MWFKNLRLYKLTREIDLNQSTVLDALEQNRFSPCASQDMQKIGWVAPTRTTDGILCHESGHHLLLMLCKEDKVLPASVIKEELENRVQILEEKEGRQARKAEKQQLKDEVIQMLLPRAFCKRGYTQLWIDKNSRWIGVDASTTTAAELALSTLRKSLGSLPVRPFETALAASDTMTSWLKQKSLPDDFLFGHEAELIAPGDDGAVIRCKNEDLLSEEISNHLNADKFATKLGLHFGEHVSFLLEQDWALKRLKFSDEVVKQHEDLSHAEPEALLEADLVLMGETLRPLFEILAEQGGGLIGIED